MVMCAWAVEHNEVAFRTLIHWSIMERKARMMNSSANNAQCLNKVTVAHNHTQAVNKHLHYVQTFL